MGSMKKTYVICEIGINHNGDLDVLTEAIALAKRRMLDASQQQQQQQ